MNPTTDLGGVGRYTHAATLTDHVLPALGEYAHHFDVAALVDDYRNKINAALSGTGIRLHGDDFYGGAVPDNSAELIEAALNNAWAQVNIAGFELSEDTSESSAGGPRRVRWQLVITEESGGEPISVDLADTHRDIIAAGITDECTEGELLIHPGEDGPAQHDALVDLAESLNLDNGDLMLIVHEVHARDAAQVNNDGLAAQIRCLLGRLGPSGVEALIRDAAADRADGDVPPSAGPDPEPAQLRVLRVVVTPAEISDELLDALADAVAHNDGTVARAAASDLAGCGAQHGLVYTVDTTMADYDADGLHFLAALRQALPAADIQEVVFAGMRVIHPAVYEKEALGT
jgi:hypothetical protein